MQNKKKVVLVTGGSAGIGYHTAKYLAGKGFTVVAVARRLDRMNPLKEMGIHTYKMDVSDTDSIDICLKNIRKEVGEIDILVNNAGIEILGPAEEIPIEKGKNLMDVNFYGVVELTTRCLPYMREQRWGRIINVSSIGGIGGMPYNSWYNASKHAVEGYTKALRQEMCEFGVAASTIRLSGTNTDIFNNVVGDKANHLIWSKDYQETFTRVSDYIAELFEKKNPYVVAKPITVSKAIYKAITDRRPRYTYANTFLTKLLIFINKYFLSESYSNILVNRNFGIENNVN